ncbi:Processing alpha glucosidase I [Podila humilis]|nr:Processing alpha glucosidase I [Podila humilis]
MQDRTRLDRTRLSTLTLAAVGLLAAGLYSISGVHASDMDPASPSFMRGILMDDSSAIQAASNQSLLWGVYRPNLYFGTRPRLPDSVMTGLMWFGMRDYHGADNIRHACEERDGFEKYGWLKHDGRSFGIQQLKDTALNVELTTEFVKIPGGEHGGSWGARISGKPIRKDEPMTISTIYYIGLDGDGSLKVENSGESGGPVIIKGNTPDLGDFEFSILQTKGARDDQPVRHAGLTLPPASVWRVKDITREVIIQNIRAIHEEGQTDNIPMEVILGMPNKIYGDAPPNLLNFQLYFNEPFEFEVHFSSKSSPNPATSESIKTVLAAAESAFDAKFESTFQLKKQGVSESMANFAKATFSNLIGGMGYFYGSSIVDESPTYEEGQSEHLEGPVARRPQPDPQFTDPASLFTAVPSRSFFPRGFYWDEGFHQILIGQWDNDLSLEVIESWFNRQDSDGWVQREQILGEEARSRVPKEFQVQYPEHANPPTLLTAINGYLDRLQDTTVSTHDVTNARLDPQQAQLFLAKLYPKLKTNYNWMRKTMQGGIRQYGRMSRSRVEGYRWGGRTKGHTLTSGLDDYPRALEPSVAELHVDLLCWIGYMGRNLQNIARILGEEDDMEEFEDHYQAIRHNVDDLHWNEDKKAYCDVTVNEDNESIQVCHKGYISLFPMSLGIIDSQSDQLGHILDLMYDPKELWTPFGLRSLSASDEFFGTGENYWKGPIWINLNYLAVHSLKTNYLDKGPHQAKAKKVYNELRSNLINNIFKEYERTGFVWEQYNDVTGHGQRSHPFTGWTSMVVKLMQMGPVK